jgi:small subunit ribosomal protein S1
MTETIKNNYDENFWNDLDVQESKRKNSKRMISNTNEDKLLLDLLNSSNIEMLEEGKIFSAKYTGLVNGFHLFTYPGLKDDIYVENRPGENKYLKNIQNGDIIDVLVSNIDEEVFFVRGSLSQLYETQAHDELINLDDAVVTIDIKSINPAGYEVDILYNGVTLPGFMPNTLAGINKLYNPESIVGQKLQAMVENYSEQEGTYIVSRRKYLKTLIPQSLDELIEGGLYEGHVTGTTPFGVFVEFNDCLTGMIHKANIVESYQDRIQEIQPGTRIEFYVKEIVKKKIILTQIMRDSLWDYIKVGDHLKGTIRDSKNFGTLVSLDDETMGLIHTSELEKLNRKFNNGDEVTVKVLAVDRQSRKIFLTV